MSIKRRLANIEKRAPRTPCGYTVTQWQSDYRAFPDAAPEERYRRLCPGAPVTPKVRAQLAAAARRRAECEEIIAVFEADGA